MCNDELSICATNHIAGIADAKISPIELQADFAMLNGFGFRLFCIIFKVAILLLLKESSHWFCK